MPTNKQRREAARRHLERQLERRAQREANRKRFTLIASVVGTIVIVAVIVVFVVAVGGDDSGKHPTAAGTSGSAGTSAGASPDASPSTSAADSTTAASYPCTWTKSGTAARDVTVPPTTTPKKKGTVTVDVSTNRGPMVFTLDRAEAPCTVESFVSLVKQKFYDNTPCPRVESESIFILQCGDPTGTGTGGPGYTIPDEYTGKESYTAGVLAMANTGAAHSGGSQFFIVYKSDQLPPNYTIFGKVTSGLKVVKTVAAGGNDGSNSAGGGKPKLAINITKMTIAKT